MSGFLVNAILYIIAAIVCVPLAKKLGMGSVLGYLIAGILIGPYLLGFITNEGQGQDIMHATEFGVVMMLFIIGLELEPGNLWKMRQLILQIGLTQVMVTAALIFGIGLLLDVQWQISLAVGLSMALSSTAIVLQSLKEKNQMNSPNGRLSFGVLLMQEIRLLQRMHQGFIAGSIVYRDGHRLYQFLERSEWSCSLDNSVLDHFSTGWQKADCGNCLQPLPCL